ncbi:MAG TPA: VWA-like domain-containing protein [Burkholderiaceae bacterium]|nr:VWA-like domain-containing protein [Burkholderiaceae bacterium]
MSKLRKPSPAEANFREGVARVQKQPLTAALVARVALLRHAHGNRCPDDGWFMVTPRGQLYAHPTRLAPPADWAYMLTHALMYLAFGHYQPDRARWPEWNLACDLVIARFLREMKCGVPPEDCVVPDMLPAWNEARWYHELCEHGMPEELRAIGPGGTGCGLQLDERAPRASVPQRWQRIFAEGLRTALNDAVEVAAGAATTVNGRVRKLRPPSERARSWFINHFPLLGAMVAAFYFIEDGDLCRRMEISVAAVNEATREIYLNPAAGLDELECRFVIAHEILHAGLRHLGRRQGRDPYLWNVACDFVINAWLIEMGVGRAPQIGALHDPQLKGLSAEAVYDRIAVDLRRYRKLMTLAGRQGDMLERASPAGGDVTDLDDFFRSQLCKGLAWHEAQGRGLLPAGLVEAIRALAQPPIPWDVALARWFDVHFPPLPTRRSYARLSRRQAASPEIPRPSRAIDPREAEGRVFGVVLDTSGSMDRTLLGKALGAIASYSEARDVAAARVIFCDARAYDAGYLAPEEIAGRVQIKGRGGTVLQPGIDVLQAACDFPPQAPVLVITDGECDIVTIRREHAFLVPPGARLPFVPRGPVFRMH